MKGRLSHNHQLLSSFCQLISFPHFDTQSIDAHLSNFENLPQKWNLSSWRLIILLLSKESKVVTFTRNCLQTPSHMLKLQAMHSPLDSCGRTPLSGVTFTLSQRLKSSQNKIFSAEKSKPSHIEPVLSIDCQLFVSELTHSQSWCCSWAANQTVKPIFLTKPYWAQLQLSDKLVRWYQFHLQILTSPCFTKVMLVIYMSFEKDWQLIYFSKDAVASDGGLPDYRLLATDSPSNQFHASRQVQPSCYWRARLPANQTSREIP